VTITETAESMGITSYIVIPSTICKATSKTCSPCISPRLTFCADGQGKGLWNQLSVIFPIAVQASIKTKTVSKFPDNGVSKPPPSNTQVNSRVNTYSFLANLSSEYPRLDKPLRTDRQEHRPRLRRNHPTWKERLLFRHSARDEMVGNTGLSCYRDESPWAGGRLGGQALG
jgi:hypothetical protein